MKLRFKGSAGLAMLGMAMALSGCANPDVDLNQPWFSKPLDITGKKGGYTFSELQDSKQRQRAITANDLVTSNGSCAAPAAPAAPAVANGPGQAAAAPAASVDTASLLGGVVALGMSECDVVFRAGQPNSVALGKNPNGDRTAVLTYNGGPRPGIYRFERGELVQMDRVATETPPPPAEKKKSAKSGKPSKADPQTSSAD